MSDLNYELLGLNVIFFFGYYQCVKWTAALTSLKDKFVSASTHLFR